MGTYNPRKLPNTAIRAVKIKNKIDTHNTDTYQKQQCIPEMKQNPSPDFQKPKCRCHP
jgi:hypothetical protein